MSLHDTILLLVSIGCALGIALSIFCRPTRFGSQQRSPAAKPAAQILVLGDIGRSPRMQYHALSVAKHGGSVQVIGYHESALIPDLAGHPNVTVSPLGAPGAWLRKLPFIIAGPLKVLYQVYTVGWVLLYATEPAEWLIVQNPPSIPTLAMAGLACFLRNTHLLIDWHNYGWTILAGTRGATHPFVTASKLYECLAGRLLPTANLTVTHAMKAELQRPPYAIASPIHTMHDRPAGIFTPITDARQRHTLLHALSVTADRAEAIHAGSMRLLVSSTSWTPDEDFALLLDALVAYGAESNRVPLLVVITGRGPQKALYEAKIARLHASGELPDIKVLTDFLTFEDYAKLLAAADLGICLHMSSSGVDLPMKVVDMFGAGLPVLAYSKYPSFGELVKDGTNGLGFEDAAQMTEALTRLLDPRNNGTELARLKLGAVVEGAHRWDEEWDRVVKPLLGFKRDMVTPDGDHAVLEELAGGITL